MFESPWFGSYEPGVPETVVPADGLFHDALLAAAAEAPGHPALEYFNRPVSFAELESLSGRMASALLGARLPAGELVLVALPCCPGLAAACLGTLRAGANVLPIAPDVELATSLARRVRPRIAITTAAIAARLEELPDADEREIVWVDPTRSMPATVRTIVAFGRLVPGRVGRRPARARELREWLTDVRAALPDRLDARSGGLVIGGPGAESRWPRFSHQHLVAATSQLVAWLTDAVPDHDTWLVLDPPWSGFGFVGLLGAAIRLRARVLLVAPREGVQIADALRYRRPAIVLGGSADVAALVAENVSGSGPARSVRAWVTDRPVIQGLARSVAGQLGLALCEGYGHRSIAGLATCNPINGRHVPGSVGLPLPDVAVRIVDRDGRAQGVGVTGRLELRGPNVSTRGWLRPSVRAHLDERGYLFLEHSSRPT